MVNCAKKIWMIFHWRNKSYSFSYYRKVYLSEAQRLLLKLHNNCPCWGFMAFSQWNILEMYVEDSIESLLKSTVSFFTLFFTLCFEINFIKIHQDSSYQHWTIILCWLSCFVFFTTKNLFVNQRFKIKIKTECF
jgi:hypothetical protein